MLLVDLDRGRADGVALAKTLEELDSGYQYPPEQLDNSGSGSVSPPL